ncbi:TPA: hypothetical protein DCL30_04300 [Candidatus Peribacteria bacterium]|nr:MAG: hypothetical protein A2529_04355 [Candidatus Peribacteria bacterium RIFOXYD2_FULL_58_15]HAI98727.1 hypothetical protein [Candidatus Peribacteria bacterium]HAS34153.1 hypothetical protein [Candidatus Peribacteria bacterium]
MPPNQPNPSGTSPELQRELEAIWRERLRLTAGTKITDDARKQLDTLLGKKKHAEVAPRKQTPDAMIVKNVCRTIAQTRSGLLPLIHEKDAKKRREKLITKLTTGGKKLETLVNDPESPEAELLAYMFETYIDPATTETDALLEKVTEAEVKSATNLLKAKELFDTLMGDDENLNIGKAAVTTGIPAPGTGRIKSLEERANANSARAAAASLAPNGNPLPFLDAEAKQREEIAKLERRKVSLGKSLDKVQSHLKEVAPACGWTTPTQIGIAAEALENSLNLPTAFNMDVKIRGKTQSVGSWMQSDDLKEKTDTVVQRHRQFGTDEPSSSVVLDDFLRLHYGSRLLTTPDPEKEQFYSQLKTILLSGVAASAAAPGAAPASAPAAPGRPASAPSGQPGLLKRAAKGVGSYLSDFIFGAK